MPTETVLAAPVAPPAPTTPRIPPPPPPPAGPVPAPPTAAEDGDEALPTHLRIEPWPDLVVDHLGHDPRSAYVERFWLPILGPSTTLLLRRIAAELDHEPDGAEVEMSPLARSLGLGLQGGKRSAFVRALDRSVQFGLAQQLGRTRLAVRRRLPPLTQRQLQRLPDPLPGQHADWLHHHRPRSEATGITRARELALDLLTSGHEVDAVERQLGRWGLHPAVAYSASRWAEQRQQQAAAALEQITAADPETEGPDLLVT